MTLYPTTPSNQHIYRLRVHIEDTDYSGVVYHSNYLNYLARARCEWSEELGLGMEWQQKHQVYFPVYTVQLHFIKPARLHELVEVVSSIKSLGKASIIYDQYLRLAGTTDKILCKAEIKIACVDYAMHPRAIPDIDILRRILT